MIAAALVAGSLCAAPQVVGAWHVGPWTVVSEVCGDESSGTSAVIAKRATETQVLCTGPYSGLTGVTGVAKMSTQQNIYLDLRDAGRRYRQHYRAHHGRFFFVREIPLDGGTRSRFSPPGAQ